MVRGAGVQPVGRARDRALNVDIACIERYVIKRIRLGIAMRAAGISLAGTLILLFARFLTAVRGQWEGIAPTDEQRIYFANHASHGDFVLIWTVLPRRMRLASRPVAGSDYWLKSRLRRFIGRDVFNAVLIDRSSPNRGADAIGLMTDALDAGSSLIVFPEGTRNATNAPLLPFKSGLFHLARARPQVVLVPVWIDNLNRVMPKGEFVPIPLICTVTFGAALHIAEGETKKDFLARAEAALLALSPKASAP
jgi:1-acyl-sn-glycerol-3-phosphate acyltransferase